MIEKKPKLKIIPPTSKIFKGVDIKKLMKIRFGKYWWNLDVVKPKNTQRHKTD